MKNRVIIVGGVAGGASAAARLRRLSEDFEIILIERGSNVSYANCGIPYYVGGEIADRSSLLLHTPQSLSKRFNLDIRTNTEVVKILPSENKVTVKSLLDGEIYDLEYSELILSTGADAIKPEGTNLDGVFTAKDIPDADQIKNYIRDNNCKKAVVIGGGYIGLEIAEQLMNINLQVTIIDRGEHILGIFDSEMAVIAKEVFTEHGASVLNNKSFNKITKSQHGLTLSFDDQTEVNTDLIIMAMGVKPNTKLAVDAEIKIGITGGIEVNSYLQTNFSNIWAIGDCIEVTHSITGKKALIALAGPANQQGRIVAENIINRSKEYFSSLGTSIIRIFEYGFASTGISEKLAVKSGIKFHKIYLYPGSHAGYFPGAETLSIKVLFSDNGDILGAQIVGKDGADKRIDILATAISAKMNIKQLAYLQLAYAPPYGSAKDPINLIGMIAENILEGKLVQAHYEDIRNSEFLLDVRTDFEYSKGSILNAVHIPLDSLRENLGKLPVDKMITVFCQSGLRSYNACRILTNKGFRCRNFSGAYNTWLNSTKSCS